MLPAKKHTDPVVTHGTGCDRDSRVVSENRKGQMRTAGVFVKIYLATLWQKVWIISSPCAQLLFKIPAKTHHKAVTLVHTYGLFKLTFHRLV